MMTTTEPRRAACVWRRLGLLASGMAALLLAGCPGTESDVEAQDRTQEVELRGVVSTGPGGTLPVQDLRVIGAQGTARDTGPACGINTPYRCGESDRYAARLVALAAPYAAHMSVFYEASGTSAELYTVATGAGRANLTPLTTLLVAQLTARDPLAFFNTTSSTRTMGIEVGAIDAAQRAVTRYLEQVLGVTVRSGTASFLTADYTPAAGDPMHDTIVALADKLAADGSSLDALARQVAVEAQRCRQQSLARAGAPALTDFCPAGRSTQADAADASVTVHRFTTAVGEMLEVRIRGNALVTVTHTRADGTASSCNDADCVGLTLDAPAADGSRGLRFSQVALDGTGGALRLSGQLTAAAENQAEPVLPCADHRFFLRRADGSLAAHCGDFSSAAVPGVPAAGTRAQRLVHRLVDGAAPEAPLIEVVHEAGRVLSVLAFHFDAASGLPVADGLCRTDACAGVSIGAENSVSDFGEALRTWRIDLRGVPLRAVLPDGSLSADPYASLDATLLALKSPEAPVTVLDCASDTQRVLVQASDETGASNVCPPTDPQGFTVLGTFFDGEGNPGYFIASVTDDGNGSFGTGDSVNVFTTAGLVARVTLSRQNGSVFECLADECTGVDIAAPNDAGETTVTLNGTRLHEVETAGLRGDRSATASGVFTAPPP